MSLRPRAWRQCRPDGSDGALGNARSRIPSPGRSDRTSGSPFYQAISRQIVNRSVPPAGIEPSTDCPARYTAHLPRPAEDPQRQPELTRGSGHTAANLSVRFIARVQAAARPHDVEPGREGTGSFEVLQCWLTCSWMHLRRSIVGPGALIIAARGSSRCPPTCRGTKFATLNRPLYTSKLTPAPARVQYPGSDRRFQAGIPAPSRGPRLAALPAKILRRACRRSSGTRPQPPGPAAGARTHVGISGHS
jgi:hypothetical protein